jgi:hypothetical protein
MTSSKWFCSTTEPIVATRLATLGVAALLGAVVTPALAGADGGGVAGDWVSRYSSARTVGLGGAFVAAADQAEGAVWNPAALAMMTRYEVHAETARLFEETSINGISFALPASTYPSLGVTLLSLSSGEVERTSELNESLGTFNESDLAVIFSASKLLTSRLSVGANFKVVRQSIEEFSATGYGADVGTLFDVTPSLRVGASMINVGGPSLTLRETSESFPTEFRVGARYRAFSGKAMLSMEMDQRSGTGAAFRTGAEVWVHPMLALRLGYDENEPAGGLSVRPNHSMQVDYGLIDHELGATHRFGLTYRFGGFYAQSAAAPEVFSPLGATPVTRFHLKSRTKSETDRWHLTLVDKFDAVVREYSGNGVPPAHLVWDGKDRTGIPLPDGVYQYRLVVRDDEGREVESSPGEVEISTSGPSGSGSAVEIG